MHITVLQELGPALQELVMVVEQLNFCREEGAEAVPLFDSRNARQYQFQIERMHPILGLGKVTTQPSPD